MGIILTNKHVVTDAPFVGKVCFRNSEEVAAWPLWRDPIHDFGFLRFDKSQVRYMDLKSIPLNPHLAKVGLSVRVPGSDAGEKLAVLSGIIARIDRPAANYGIGNYCDFNTFYIQASANTSGGSSGSPVINEDGAAVAINAGGSTSAASSFFLPLYRVKRALDLLRKSIVENSIITKTNKSTILNNLKSYQRYVPRGTIQVEFIQKQYDECRRLGLQEEFEKRFREKSPDLNGLLAVRNIIPNGPAFGRLVAGDLLIKVENKFVNHYVELADVLDEKSSVWDDDDYFDNHHPLSQVSDLNTPYTDVTSDLERPYVTLTIFRNKEFLEIDIMVDSLHRISPDMYLELGGSVIHPLSYQLARSYLHEVGSVFVSDSGQMLGVAGIPNYSIITSINHINVPNIKDFVNVVKKIPSGKRVPIKYYILSKKNVEIIKIITIEKNYGRFRFAKKNDSRGIWDYFDIKNEEIDKSSFPCPSKASYLYVNPSRGLHSQLSAKLIKSLCVVESHMPFGINGYNDKWTEGVGIIVDDVSGLVVVSKATVPTSLGKLFVTFANNVIIPAKLIWTHPLQNVVVIRYDTKTLLSNNSNNKIINTTSVEFSDAGPLLPGDEINLVSISGITHTPRVVSTQVKSKGHFIFGDLNPPRHRTINWDDGVALLNPLCEEAGVLVDNDGRCRGLWLIFPENNSHIGYEIVRGVGLHKCLQNIIESQSLITYEDSGSIKTSTNLPLLRCINAEFTETYFWKARELGLSEAWINRISEARSSKLKNFLRLFPDSNDHGSIMSNYESDKEYENVSYAPDRYTITTVRRVPASNEDKNTFDLKEGDLVLGYKKSECETKIPFVDDPNIIPITQMTGPIMDFIKPEFKDEIARPLQFAQHSKRFEMLNNGVSMCDTIQWPGNANDDLKIIILRDGKEIEITVPRIIISGAPKVDIIHWAGAILQNPHRMLSFHVKHIPKGLYISLMFNGSPAQRDQMSACWFVTEVDGHAVEDIDSFLRVVEGEEYNNCVPIINPIGEKGWHDESELIKLRIQQDSNVVCGSGSSNLIEITKSLINQTDKNSSENKLEKSNDNITRLNDIIRPGSNVSCFKDSNIKPEADFLCAECLNEIDKPTTISYNEGIDLNSDRESESKSPHDSATFDDASFSENVTLENDECTKCGTIVASPIKASIVRSYRLRLISLEQVQKVVTVEVDLASKNYWPTWRAVVE